MYWLSLILLMVLGLLGAANQLTRGRPDAKRLIAQIRPWQGWIGAVGVVVGLISTIQALLNIDMIQVSLFFWLMWLVVGLMLVSLGFLLSYPLIAEHLLSRGSASVRDKADEVRDKLAPHQTRLGMAALLTAILSLILRILT